MYMCTVNTAIKQVKFVLTEWISQKIHKSVSQVILSVCLSVESMWHDSSRKGGEPFSLAGNKCTSLSLGLQPEGTSLLWMQREKWGDVTFPERAEVRQPISLSHMVQKERDQLPVVLVLVKMCISTTTRDTKSLYLDNNKTKHVLTPLHTESCVLCIIAAVPSPENTMVICLYS